MWRTLFRWLSPLVLTGGLLWPADAQIPSQLQPSDKKNTPVQELRWRDDQPSTLAQTTPSGGTSRVPVGEYVVAIAGTLLILLILCTPSRKPA
jgi:hypothetical protein